MSGSTLQVSPVIIHSLDIPAMRNAPKPPVLGLVNNDDWRIDVLDRVGPVKLFNVVGRLLGFKHRRLGVDVRRGQVGRSYCLRHGVGCL
jgi:hypothetical protein